jgi:rhodanese-related sulfurtransferase
MGMNTALVLLGALSSIIIANSGDSEDRKSILELLERSEETREALRSSYVRSRTVSEIYSTSEDFRRSVGQDKLYVGQNEIYRRGLSIHLYHDNFLPIPDVSQADGVAFRPTRQSIWDGRTRYEIYGNRGSAPTRIHVSQSQSHPSGTILPRGYFGSPVEGYFPGDDDNIAVILREESVLGARVSSSTLDGAKCYVVAADINDRGRYRVWLDPEHGYNIRRAEAVKTRGDIYFGQRLPSGQGKLQIVAVQFILVDVGFRESNGVWLPVSGQWHITRTYGNGSIDSAFVQHRCLEVECTSDDLRFAEAFVPRVPAGTVAYTEGKSSVLREEWADGAPRPVVDWQTVDTIKELTREYVERNRHDDKTAVDSAPPSSETGPSAKAARPLDLDGPPKRENRAQRQAHCGLYCIYAAAHVFGLDLDFGKLLNPRYLGSVRGSSLGDLKEAAGDCGLYAEPVQNLTIADLRGLRGCCILHVKGDLRSPTYNHYALFLGMEDEKAVLLDAPNLDRVPIVDIVPQWDGAGLLLSDRPIELGGVILRGRVRFIGYAACVLGVVIIARRAKRSAPWGLSRLRPHPLCLSGAQAFVLGTVALATALTYHSLWQEGMLHHKKATQAVQDAYAASFLPRIGFERAQALLDDGAVFIDARHRQTYDMGHVPGAISIPVDANDSEYQARIEQVPRHVPIVAYCQSAYCPYADQVAARLTRDGIGKVLIFKGGWYEWSARKRDDH